jgi:hypothetical protein
MVESGVPAPAGPDTRRPAASLDISPVSGINPDCHFSLYIGLYVREVRHRRARG